MATTEPGARSAIAVAILLWSSIALAQPAPTAPEPGDFSPPEPTCIEWTNLCRLCKLSDSGTPVCSNIGIACQPEALRCTRYKAEDKDDRKDEKK